MHRPIVQCLGHTPHPRRPLLPRPPVVAIPVHQVVRGVRHLVEKRVDTFHPIPFEHQIDVQRDLDHIACALSPTRQHMAQRRLHSTAQAYRDVGRQNPAEARLVEIAIDGPEIVSLVGSRTAVCSAPFSARGCTQARLMFRTRLFDRALKLRPFMNPSVGGPGLRCADTSLGGDHRKRIEQLRRRTTICNVHVERRTSLRQRPDRASVSPKRYTMQLQGAATAELVQKLGRCERVHASSEGWSTTEERTRMISRKRWQTLAKKVCGCDRTYYICYIHFIGSPTCRRHM